MFKLFQLYIKLIENTINLNREYNEYYLDMIIVL